MLSGDDLRGALIPAVPVPFDPAGRSRAGAQARYVEHMAARPVGGVAVWAHTGRGLLLDRATRADVLTAWRRGLGDDRFVVAGAGPTPGETDRGRLFESALAMAREAADLGADALLAHPPTALRGAPDRDRLVLDYHEALFRAGLPLILFYLYEEAGGLSYPPEVLRALLARPEVLGIKVATLDSVMTFQEIAALVREEAPGKVLVTGEDRFLGYSLTCGAEAALIGMGAACTELQADLLRSHREGDAGRFLALDRRVDDLARHTFRPPMEGYIRRMLWCLVHEGVIPEEAAHDPWGPPLDSAERERLHACLDRIRAP